MGESPRYPLERLGGFQIRSGWCGVEKNLFLLLGIRPQLPSLWPVACHYSNLSGLPMDWNTCVILCLCSHYVCVYRAVATFLDRLL
jgi:hypothetical protein